MTPLNMKTMLSTHNIFTNANRFTGNNGTQLDYPVTYIKTIIIHHYVFYLNQLNVKCIANEPAKQKHGNAI